MPILTRSFPHPAHPMEIPAIGRSIFVPGRDVPPERLYHAPRCPITPPRDAMPNPRDALPNPRDAMPNPLPRSPSHVILLPFSFIESQWRSPPMQLEFVPIEEFYFELTLAVKTLEEIETPGLAAIVGQKLQEKFQEPSTVAAASQNTYNYVFRVTDVDNSPFHRLIISIADWGGNLRLGSDYGWTLNEEHRATKSERFPQRVQFAADLKAHLQDWLAIDL
ncbi:MAG: hypothetical protein VKJ24_14445 [Synechococcales bacterium]|nr:hypothetical protein [Synechococcales bacterium]